QPLKSASAAVNSTFLRTQHSFVNWPCRASNSITMTLLHFGRLDGVTNGGFLKLGFGFDPRIETIAVQSNRSVELQSGVAPPLVYNLLATTNLSDRAPLW